MGGASRGRRGSLGTGWARRRRREVSSRAARRDESSQTPDSRPSPARMPPRHSKQSSRRTNPQKKCLMKMTMALWPSTSAANGTSCPCSSRTLSLRAASSCDEVGSSEGEKSDMAGVCGARVEGGALVREVGARRARGWRGELSATRGRVRAAGRSRSILNVDASNRGKLGCFGGGRGQQGEVAAGPDSGSTRCLPQHRARDRRFAN